MSDTHGSIALAEKAIRAEMDIDLIIHLGDHYKDAQKLAYMFSDISFEYICGNCDLAYEGVRSEKVLEIGGKNIMITHRHRYSVKEGPDKLYKRAEEKGLDLILFGHTHIAEINDKGHCCLINPGSISEPRGSKRGSYAILDISNGTIQAKIIYV